MVLKKVLQPYPCIQPHDVPYHIRAAAFPCRKHTHHARGMNDECALDGATRAGTQAPPLPISIKPCVVCPLPRSGYTFDSAGLASATQPTLGNGGQQGGYPQRGLYFLSPQTNDAAPHANDAAPCTIHPNETHKQSPHTTIGGGNASRTPAPSTLNEWNFMILASP